MPALSYLFISLFSFLVDLACLDTYFIDFLSWLMWHALTHIFVYFQFTLVLRFVNTPSCWQTLLSTDPSCCLNLAKPTWWCLATLWQRPMSAGWCSRVYSGPMSASAGWCSRVYSGPMSTSTGWWVYSGPMSTSTGWWVYSGPMTTSAGWCSRVYNGPMSTSAGWCSRVYNGPMATSAGWCSKKMKWIGL